MVFKTLFLSLVLTSGLRELLKIVLSILIIPLGLPSGVGILFLSVYYVIVVLLSGIFRPELSILPGSDAMWAAEAVYKHAETNNVINLICDGEMSVEDLRALFQKHVLNYRDPVSGLSTYRRLLQRWTTFLGYYFWIDEEEFDLNHHVRLYDYAEPDLVLPSPCTQADLVRVTGKLLGRPYRKGTSPWELLLIPNYTQDKGKHGLVLCLRFHHSLGDGYSIVGLIHRIFDSPMPPPMGKFALKLSPIQWALRYLTVILLIPYESANWLVDTFQIRREPWTPRKSQGSCVMLCSEHIDWQDVRTAMRKYKVNSNAAIYSIMAAAAFRSMEEAGQGVPSGTVCGFTPFPVPNHPGGLVNHTSGTYFNMKPRIHSGAKLVKTVGKQIRSAHALDRLAVIANLGLRIVGTVCPAWIWWLGRIVIRTRVGPRFVFTATSVPGPVKQLEIGGIRLVDIIPSMGPPRGGPTAAVATMMSFAGKVRIIINVDQGAFDGFRVPVGFAKHVEHELNILLLSDKENIV